MDIKHIGNKEENQDEILRTLEECLDIWRSLDQSNLEVKKELIVLLKNWATILNEFELYDEEQEVRCEMEKLLKSLPESDLDDPQDNDWENTDL